MRGNDGEGRWMWTCGVSHGGVVFVVKLCGGR